MDESYNKHNDKVYARGIKEVCTRVLRDQVIDGLAGSVIYWPLRNFWKKEVRNNAVVCNIKIPFKKCCNNYKANNVQKPTLGYTTRINVSLKKPRVQKSI